MNARQEILARVRDALASADREPVHVPLAHRSRPARTGLVDTFAERARDYRAAVTRVDDTHEAVVAAVVTALPEGARVVLPPGLPWELGDRVEAVVDSAEGAGPLAARELDRCVAVVTAAAVGIAETGTIVLTHEADQGRRAISLVPDLHVCVVRADQVVADVPAAIAGLDPGRPQTWISGPSATSDIELDRVEGVHGPRRLHVLIVG